MKLLLAVLNLRKTTRNLIILPVLVAVSTQLHGQTVSNANIGLFYPLSTRGTHARADTNLFSFNLIAGISAAERGVAFSGFSNIVRHDAFGIQFAGFSNHVGKHADGTMFAGFINTYHSGKGVAFAGFSNIATGNVPGVQFAGFLNRAAAVEGAQFAGFQNIAADVKGSQAAGFINLAKDVKGSQFAGFINIAKKVKGIQFAGFINIADSSDHPLGIINIIKNGERSIGVSIDDSRTTMLSFRSGGKVLYGIIAAGYNFKNEEEVYALEAGLGAHLMNTDVFRVKIELSALSLESFHQGEYFKSSLKFMPSIRPFKNLEVFAGPVFNYINTNTAEGRGLIDKYIWSWENRWSNNFQGIYVGYSGGINIIF